MIPRCIHQIWIGGKPLPEKFTGWSQTFRDLNPRWEHRLWHDAQVEALIQERFPQHLATYRRIEKLAQKADFARYMIIAVHGGAYADADCECLRPLDFLADADELVVALELKTPSRILAEIYRAGTNELYCQWTFLARAGHPFLLALVEEVARRVTHKISDDPVADVIRQTGPGVFSDVLKQHFAAGGTARVVPGSYFGCPDGRSLWHFRFTALFPTLLRTVYVRHHPSLSWLDPQQKRDWLIRNLFLLGPPKSAPALARCSRGNEAEGR